MSDRLHICQTCERDGASERDGRTRGEHLTAAVAGLLARSDLAGLLSVRRVPCLSGCPNPCNVSFRAPGKTSLRFSRLAADDAAELLAFARLYVASATGEVEKTQWPESLRDRLTASLPAPPAAGVPLVAATRDAVTARPAAPASAPREVPPAPMVMPTPNLPPARRAPHPSTAKPGVGPIPAEASAAAIPSVPPRPADGEQSEALLRIEGAHKRFGSVVALDRLRLEVAEGEFFALLGPSASGKTTTLRCIAGVERLDAGRVHFGGEEITASPVQGRSMAMIFQTFALYPHLSVFSNLAYPLRELGLARDEVEKRVQETAEMLGLDHVLQRRPGTASGGEQQRIAIGRALIRRPRLLLLDEPTTNLDAKLRHDTRAEFKRLHRDLGMTMVYATPDELEALSMGERIGVLRAGRIVQTGTPDEIYDRPDNEYVAAMVGSPKINFVDARLTDVNTVDLGFVEIGDGPWRKAASRFPAGTPVRFGFRPYDVNGTIDGPRFKARVELLEPLGDVTVMDLRARHTPFRMVLPEAEAIAWSVNDDIELAIDAAQSHLFAADTGVAIR